MLKNPFISGQKISTPFLILLSIFSLNQIPIKAQVIESRPSEELYGLTADSLSISTPTLRFPYHKHQLGFSFSTFSGYGLSYRYLPSEKILLKFTAFGFSHSINNTSISSELTETTITFGAEVQYTFTTFETTRFYLLGGISRFYEQKANSFSGGPNRVSSSIEDWTMGFGVGSEFRIVSRFFLNIDIGFTYAPSSRFNESRLPQNSTSISFGLSGGAGFSYGF